MPNKLLIVDLFMTSMAELKAVLPFIIMRPLCQSFIHLSYYVSNNRQPFSKDLTFGGILKPHLDEFTEFSK